MLSDDDKLLLLQCREERLRISDLAKYHRELAKKYHLEAKELGPTKLAEKMGVPYHVVEQVYRNRNKSF